MHAYTRPEDEVTGVAASEVSSEKGSRVSATVPESDSTAPAGLVSRGQGEASLFTCLCQECRGCQGPGINEQCIASPVGRVM